MDVVTHEAHGWNNISARMIKLCGKSIALLYMSIFQSILKDDVFPGDLKKECCKRKTKIC